MPFNYNKENVYELEKNFLFGEKGLYSWPCSYDDAYYFVQQAPYSPNKEHLIKTEPPSDPEKLEMVTQDWSFAIFVKSALYFVLKEKTGEEIKFKGTSLNKYDLSFIMPLMLNYSINKEIILFIEDLYKVPYDFLIVAAHLTIRRLILFKRLIMSESSLNDFLIFLKIDIASREILVKKSFRDRNFYQLADFLFAFKSSLNQNLILSEILKNYNYYVKNEKFYLSLSEMEIKILELLELKRDSLETFDIFDMFDSSEISKSKNSELNFFYFYEKLLEKPNNSVTEDFLIIFRLFEDFLNASKDKSILLAEIYFEKSSKFYKFIESFYFSYQEKIKSILLKKSRFFQKFYKAGISYEIIGLGGLLAFIALLQVLGVKSSRRSNTPSTPNTCFASISASFGQNRNSSRAELQSSSAKLLGNSASIQPLQQNKPLSLLQNRVLPKNTSVSISQPRSSKIITTSKSSLASNFDSNLTNISQKSTKIIVKGDLRFENLTAGQCMDLLAKELQEKFPGSFISIRPTFRNINGIYQEASEISLTTTFSQFGRLDRIKSDVIKGVKETNGSILFSYPANSDRNHTLNAITRRIFDIEKSRAAAVFVQKFIHNKIGASRTYQIPAGMGYTSGTGGSLFLIDHLCEQDRLLLQDFENDPIMVEFLNFINSSPAELEKSYKGAFGLDRNLVVSRMGDNMDENTHLAMSYDTYLNRETEVELESLTKRICQVDRLEEIHECATMLEQFFQKGQNRREHTYAVKAFLKKGTRAHNLVILHEQKAVGSARQLLTFVQNQGGKIDPKVEELYLSDTSSNLLAPDEAYNLAEERLGLKDLKKPLRKIIGPRRHSPNYPKS